MALKLRTACAPRMWKVTDLTHHRTIDLGEAWVTDCVWLPFHGRLAVASSDHTVRACPLSPLSRSALEVCTLPHEPSCRA